MNGRSCILIPLAVCDGRCSNGSYNRQVIKSVGRPELGLPTVVQTEQKVVDYVVDSVIAHTSIMMQ